MPLPAVSKLHDVWVRRNQHCLELDSRAYGPHTGQISTLQSDIHYDSSRAMLGRSAFCALHVPLRGDPQTLGARLILLIFVPLPLSSILASRSRPPVTPTLRRLQADLT